VFALKKAFPADFLWGTATSAYQVEGGICNDWSQAGHDAGAGVAHAERYREDFEWAQSLNTNAFRLSLEWARLEPQEGVWDSAAEAHYLRVFEALQEAQLEPMVTLFHFTLPVWFAAKGGWTRAENGVYFQRFAERVAQRFGHCARLWITLNEPMVYVFKCFDEGLWPPFIQDRSLALRVFQNLLRGHTLAYHSLHANAKQIQVGIAKNFTLLEPLNRLHPGDQMQAYFQDRIFNRAFVMALMEGHFEMYLPGSGKITVPMDPAMMGSLDFLGVNYYTRFRVNARGAHLTPSNAPSSDLGWEIYPEGLFKVLQLAQSLTAARQMPLYITENGLADATDLLRGPFLTAHLAQLAQALHAGIPVKGYFYWSLLDNFEWAEGYGPRFGLLDAERRLRPSAKLYQSLIQAAQAEPQPAKTKIALKNQTWPR